MILSTIAELYSRVYGLCRDLTYSEKDQQRRTEMLDGLTSIADAGDLAALRGLIFAYTRAFGFRWVKNVLEHDMEDMLPDHADKLTDMMFMTNKLEWKQKNETVLRDLQALEDHFKRQQQKLEQQPEGEVKAQPQGSPGQVRVIFPPMNLN